MYLNPKGVTPSLRCYKVVTISNLKKDHHDRRRVFEQDDLHLWFISGEVHKSSTAAMSGEKSPFEQTLILEILVC